MVQRLNPQKFGLSSKTNLEKTGRNHYAIVIERKSRISVKDGEKILDKVRKMREMAPEVQIDLITTAPVCGKAVSLLKANGIDIISH
jgi:hypothetical protein